MLGQEFVFGDLSIACVEGMKEGRKHANLGLYGPP